MTSSSAANEATQSSATNKIEFTCYGGCLISFLIIIVLGTMLSFNDNLIEFHVETYNTKKSGINKDVTNEIINGFTKETSKNIAKKFQSDFSTHTPFMMVRFIDVIKKLIKKDEFTFTWGIGTNASGQTDENKKALLLYKHVQLNKRFNKFRNNETSDIFTDLFAEKVTKNKKDEEMDEFETDEEKVEKTEKDKEKEEKNKKECKERTYQEKEKERRKKPISYNNYLLDKCRGKVVFYHPLCGSLPMQLFMNIFFEKTKKYSDDKLFKYNKDFSESKQSILIKSQQYIVDIRYVLFLMQ